MVELGGRRLWKGFDVSTGDEKTRTVEMEHREDGKFDSRASRHDGSSFSSVTGGEPGTVRTSKIESEGWKNGEKCDRGDEEVSWNRSHPPMVAYTGGSKAAMSKE